MIAVVYSGSKSAFWKISDEGKIIAECTIHGFNPCLNDSKQILLSLNKTNILINYAESIKKYSFLLPEHPLLHYKSL